MSGNPLAIMTPEELATVPAVNPPDGVHFNLENPHSDGPKLIIAGALLMALMYAFAGVRYYMKAIVRKQFSADDCK
jgi:hypothetical protein